MKLGVSYIAFEGEELLEYAVRPIRCLADHISVVYQTVSFFGNPAHPELVPNLERLKAAGLIDELVCHVNDLKLSCKTNEVNARNVGRELSREAGCSHHISADVDEMYEPDQLEFAKREADGYDCSVAFTENYYRHPTYRIHPRQDHRVSLIQPVGSVYDTACEFPFGVDESRKCMPSAKCRVFGRDEFVVHHMSYVRKDVRRKVTNNSNGWGYSVNKFVSDFDKYRLGEILRVAPDFVNRRTVLAENKFGIEM